MDADLRSGGETEEKTRLSASGRWRGWRRRRLPVSNQSLARDLMDLSAFAIQLFSGLSRAMVLFLLSAGLSLIFGVMNILNFAHATLWLVGGYVTYSIFEFLGGQFGASPWLLLPAILGATAAMAAAGFALERYLIRRTYGRDLPEQLLLTFALVLIIGDLIKLVWGVENRRISLGIEPIEMLDTFVNPYHFVIIATGVAVAFGLWFFLHRTRFGKIVRAAVYSRNMVSALGIPIPMIYSGVFALGVGLALAAGIALLVGRRMILAHESRRPPR